MSRGIGFWAYPSVREPVSIKDTLGTWHYGLACMCWNHQVEVLSLECYTRRTMRVHPFLTLL